MDRGACLTCAPQLQLLLRAWRRVVTAPRPLTAAAAAATLRSRRDIENVDKQSVQLIVLVSMLPTVPGMLVLVEYSNDEIRPMVATALPALDWLSGRKPSSGGCVAVCRRVRRNTGGWQQQRRATSSSASRCRYEYGNDDGRLQQGKGSARASHPEAGPAHIRATSLPLSVPRRSLLSRSYLGWGVVPPFSSWRVFAEGAACG